MPFVLSSERVLLFLTAIVGAGFLLGETEFSKVGIPLPIAGNSSVAHPSLFIFEIFLLFSLGFVVFFYAKERSLPKLSSIQWGLVGFLVFVSARILWDLPSNPLLVIRSSSFAWYLFLSLLVSIFPVSVKNWEKLFSFFFWMVLANLIFSVFLFISIRFFQFFIPIPWFFFESSGPRWGLAIGIYGIIAYLLSTKKRWVYLPLVFIGLAFGIEAASKFSRTNLVGAGLVVALMLGLVAFKPRVLLQRVLKVFLVLLSAFLLQQVIVSSSWYGEVRKNLYTDYKREYYEKNIAPPTNPFIKSDAGGATEGFRYFMWKDAWGLFRQHPFAGIGFLEQVVYRFYVGGEKQFLPNSGIHFEPVFLTAPIAGPHNSYLNAIARLGIIGSVFLVFHLFCLFILIQSGLYAVAFALAGGMLYASLNVGLEGPARSFFLLIALGVAMRVWTERKNANSSI